MPGIAASMLTRVVSRVMPKQKAFIVNIDTKEKIDLQFNPAEYKLTESADYSQIPRQNSDSPVLNFAGGSAPQLNMTFYFDSFEDDTMMNTIQGKEAEDVSKKVEKIAKIRKIEGKVHRPPSVAFVWGSLKFVGFVKSITSTYTMFDKGGKPLRAKVDIVFIAYSEPEGERISPFESPDRTKIRVLSEDESLWNLAYKEYGDAGMWRHIAEANGIMDPLSIPVGTVLKVPAL